MSFPLRRAFVALPLEGEAKHAFQQVQSRLAEYDRMFRFQNPETPHLTLHYFGELMEIEYGDVTKKMQNIADRTSPFTITVTGADVFKGRQPPTVLFLTVARSQELAMLKKRCPWPSTQVFHPHITLARMKKPHDFVVHQKKIMKLLKDISFEVPIDGIRMYAEIEGKQQTPIVYYSIE